MSRQQRHLSNRDILTHPIHILSFGFGSGLSPRAPGTFGSAAAIPFWLLFHDQPLMIQALIIAVSFVLGCYFCHVTANAMKVHDHPGIVWDEFVGIWIPLMLIGPEPMAILVVFALFRFFDVLKPWPINWLDRRVSGGVGIMVDDVVAGLYAVAVLAGLQAVFPNWI